jgi:hypothetical protein
VHWSILVLLLTVKSGKAPTVPTHTATLNRSVLAALHWSLPHSIYIVHSLIRINAGSFGGEDELDRAGTEEAGIWRKR